MSGTGTSAGSNTGTGTQIEPDVLTLELIVGENSYISIDDADVYLSFYAGTLWDELSLDDKARALVTAARRLDRLIFKGTQAEDEQPMEWPRSGNLKGVKLVELELEPEVGTGTALGTVVGSEVVEPEPVFVYTIPKAIPHAQCEEALALLEDAGQRAQRERLQAAGVRSFWIGQLREEYVAVSPLALNSLLSGEAKRLLRPYVLTVVELAV